jgi:hypothetical protein
MQTLKHLLRILVAYLVASIITGYVVDISLLGYSGGAGDDARRDILGFGVLVSFFVTFFAACPAAATVAWAEYKGWRMWWYYAVVGSLIGLALGNMFKPPHFFPWLGLGFGPVAGLIYWAVAGRHARSENLATRRVTFVTTLAIAVVLALYLGASVFGTAFLGF